MPTIIVQSDSDGRARRCDARCHKAGLTNCRCICEGRYHGCARGFPSLPASVEEAEMMLAIKYELEERQPALIL